jgi:hypothetical protein
MPTLRLVLRHHRALLALFALSSGVIAACGNNDSTPQSSDAGSDSGANEGGGGGDDASPDGATEGGVSPANYADPSMWLCGANTTHDYCLDSQTVTTLAADGSKTTSMLTPAANPPIDCFYVYPTIDLSSAAGNVKDFSNLNDLLDPIHAQAAPFTQVCKVYAPLYHQVTFNAYQSPMASMYLETAYADVAAAFHEYMTTYNKGRDFVLIGHSQGSHMLRRLIQREVESQPAVSPHLVVALLAGALGDTYVPKGGVVGGSFKNTPLCTSDTQKGCVFTWNSYAKGYEPTSTYGAGFMIPAGMDIGCASPASPAGGKALLTGSLFFPKPNGPVFSVPQNTGVTTAFAGYPAFYSGQCTAASNGYSFFEIEATPAVGDLRTAPIPFDNMYYSPYIIGLHILDYTFPMQDALDAVSKRIGTFDGGPTDAGGD